MSVNDVTAFLLQLEGPYRWYVISGIIVILTAIITRFIFKTLKWFLIIAAAAVVIIAIVQYLTPIDLLGSIGDLSDELKATSDLKGRGEVDIIK